MKSINLRLIIVPVALLAVVLGIIAYSNRTAVTPVANATVSDDDALSYLPLVRTEATATLTPSPTPSATPEPTATNVPPPRAFPGAEGFGAYAVGGRGGRVIEVTNLNDSGPGSLRAAIEAEGPRIVVFRVGGTIEIQSTLDINNPYITIAGQTAPGDGVTIKLNGSSLIRINNNHDVVIRHIRFRHAGDHENRDSLSISEYSHDIIVDHCSASWGTDEVLSAGGNHTEMYNISIQWCIIAEGLTAFSSSKGSLVSGGLRDASVHHNLYAHNDTRNPTINGDKDTLGDIDVLFDFVNNVIYNWDSYATGVTGNAQVNVINNFFKAGPNTTDVSGPREVLYWDRRRNHRIYMNGNIGSNCPSGCDPDEDWDHMAGWWDGQHSCFVSQGECLSSKSDVWIEVPSVTTYSAQEAYNQVLEGAGATLGLNADGTFFWRRDAVDQRIVADVMNGTGNIIGNPSEVGGFPALDPGTPYADVDQDGMADEWENLNGFNPDDPSDGPQDADGDGYTNVEEFLNGTAPLAIN